MSLWDSAWKKIGNCISTGGLFGLFGGAAGGIIGGAAGLVAGGPVGVIPGVLKGVKIGFLGGTAVGTALKAMNIPVIDLVAKALNQLSPIRAVNNWIRSGIESLKAMGAKSDIMYLMAKIKRVLFKLLTIVVKALGRNNEKVTETIRKEAAEKSQAAKARGKEEPAREKRDKGLVKEAKKTKEKAVSIAAADRPSREKTAATKEPVRAGRREPAGKAVAAAEKAKAGPAARLSQVPVKRVPVKDLSQVLNSRSATVRPIVGKSVPEKDLTKAR